MEEEGKMVESVPSGVRCRIRRARMADSREVGIESLEGGFVRMCCGLEEEGWSGRELDRTRGRRRGSGVRKCILLVIRQTAWKDLKRYAMIQRKRKRDRHKAMKREGKCTWSWKASSNRSGIARFRPPGNTWISLAYHLVTAHFT